MKKDSGFDPPGKVSVTQLSIIMSVHVWGSCILSILVISPFLEAHCVFSSGQPGAENHKTVKSVLSITL